MKTVTCDVCGNEMPDGRTAHEIEHSTQTSFADKAPARVLITVKLTRALNGQWNGGDVCLPCIREAVARGTEIRKTLRGQQ